MPTRYYQASRNEAFENTQISTRLMIESAVTCKYCMFVQARKRERLKKASTVHVSIICSLWPDYRKRHLRRSSCSRSSYQILCADDVENAAGLPSAFEPLITSFLCSMWLTIRSPAHSHHQPQWATPKTLGLFENETLWHSRVSAGTRCRHRRLLLPHSPRVSLCGL